jgi:hypothetical protein
MLEWNGVVGHRRIIRGITVTVHSIFAEAVKAPAICVECQSRKRRVDYQCTVTVTP